MPIREKFNFLTEQSDSTDGGFAPQHRYSEKRAKGESPPSGVRVARLGCSVANVNDGSPHNGLPNERVLGVRPHRPYFTEDIERGLVEVVVTRDRDQFPIKAVDDAIGSAAQRDGPAGDCLEYRLEVRRRAADDLEHR